MIPSRLLNSASYSRIRNRARPLHPWQQLPPLHETAYSWPVQDHSECERSSSSPPNFKAGFPNALVRLLLERFPPRPRRPSSPMGTALPTYHCVPTGSSPRTDLPLWCDSVKRSQWLFFLGHGDFLPGFLPVGPVFSSCLLSFYLPSFSCTGERELSYKLQAVCSTSHPSNIRNFWPLIGLWLIYLKWLGLHLFKSLIPMFKSSHSISGIFSNHIDNLCYVK